MAVRELADVSTRPIFKNRRSLRAWALLPILIRITYVAIRIWAKKAIRANGVANRKGLAISYGETSGAKAVLSTNATERYLSPLYRSSMFKES